MFLDAPKPQTSSPCYQWQKQADTLSKEASDLQRSPCQTPQCQNELCCLEISGKYLHVMIRIKLTLCLSPTLCISPTVSHSLSLLSLFPTLSLSHSVTLYLSPSLCFSPTVPPSLPSSMYVREREG